MSGVRYNDPKVFDIRKRSSRKGYKSKKMPKVSDVTKEYVKRAIKTGKEDNWENVSESATNLGYDNPLLSQWSLINQGDTVNLRNGDRIQPTSLEVNFRMTFGIAPSQIARVMIIQWKPDNGVDAPFMNKILSTSGTDYSVHSPLIQSKVLRSKFAVLYDRTIPNLNSVTGSAYAFRVKIKKFSGKYIYYNAGATTGKNQIYVLAFSDTTVASASAPNIRRIAHLKWKDTA